MNSRYAVLLKVHYWDDFTERRLQHLVRKAGTGDVYLFLDETNGHISTTPYDRVIRATTEDMRSLGVLLFPPGRAFWYNADYPLYYFYLRNSDYDYYLMCEYDAVCNVELDDIVGIAETDGLDYVAFRFRSDMFHWHETCDGVYPVSTVLHKWLNCISLHSKRSVEFLLKRRRDLTRRYELGEIRNWPYSEVFIPTEMLNNGFVVRDLSEFGKVDRYNWWPPTRESDLPALHDQSFLHPVLDEPKYIASCVRHGRLQSYLWHRGQLRRLLKGSSSPVAVRAIIKEFKRRLVLRACDGVWWRQLIGRIRASN